MLNSPSFVPIATWPAELTATALECWLGGKGDKVEAPPILCFLPRFSLTIPIFSTFLVVGLKARTLLSSAVV